MGVLCSGDPLPRCDICATLVDLSRVGMEACRAVAEEAMTAV